MEEQPVLAGAEPFQHEGGRTGVLVSHGFTGSPQSMRFLAEGLAAAGYSIYLPRLKGHGTTPADMGRSTAQEWVAGLQSGLEWLQARCDAVFMTGLSMGGTLTLLMAGLYPQAIKGIAPINGAVFLNSPDLAALPYTPGLPPEIPGVGGDIKAPGVTELAYTSIPVPAVKELYALMRAADDFLPRITCPALVITSREDHIVPPANGDYILQRLGSPDKQALWLENSYHVATLDNDKELILDSIVNFIQKNG